MSATEIILRDNLELKEQRRKLNDRIEELIQENYELLVDLKWALTTVCEGCCVSCLVGFDCEINDVFKKWNLTNEPDA